MNKKIFGRDRNSVIVGFLLFTVSTIAYASLAYEAHFIIDSFSFKEAKGFITKSYYSASRTSGSATTDYVIHLDYKYTVDGIEYTGDKVDTSIALRAYIAKADAINLVKK